MKTINWLRFWLGWSVTLAFFSFYCTFTMDHPWSLYQLINCLLQICCGSYWTYRIIQWKKENEAKIPKDLPLFFLAGTKDSVSANTKKSTALMKRYKKNGMTNISHKYYPEARHETLHELKETREEFIKDCIQEDFDRVASWTEVSREIL